MALTVIPVPGPGAEDVAVGPDGSVYTGTGDGVVWRIVAGEVSQLADTGGRPLGLEVAPDGRVLVCDTGLGRLLWVDPDGTVTPLESVPMVFCNNAAIGSDGTIWFSDSSREFPLEHWKRDLITNTRSGRLLRLRDGRTEVVLEGLAFANGVALAADESYVAVAETAARTVVRLWLTGPRAGTRDLLCADLPGYPDNIARGSDGLIWVTIASPVDGTLRLLHRAPRWIRALAARLPDRLQPAPRRTVRVQAYDDHGTCVHDLDLAADGYHMVTGVREHEGRVWFGSLHEAAVAYTDLA